MPNSKRTKSFFMCPSRLHLDFLAQLCTYYLLLDTHTHTYSHTHMMLLARQGKDEGKEKTLDMWDMEIHHQKWIMSTLNAATTPEQHRMKKDSVLWTENSGHWTLRISNISSSNRVTAHPEPNSHPIKRRAWSQTHSTSSTSRDSHGREGGVRGCFRHCAERLLEY